MSDLVERLVGRARQALRLFIPMREFETRVLFASRPTSTQPTTRERTSKLVR